ncbi:helix-turn-helix domain-containing protein [Agrilactobacillus yilanensis]|uniref:Helix-turn-helix domain-containing protein n=1 Tax=Agrilactobacillus yilanensis TaxID=2485997 RepID=A0ABW4JAB0_9LACO|nr:helix-turn-helix transcriptional regulator [Agrilactobacillus yilanensis]
MKFGIRLKQERSKKGMTQEMVARELNLSRQTISSWENERSYPDIQKLVALSDLYKVSLDVLLREDDDMMQHLETQGKFSRNAVKILEVSYIGDIILWFVWAITALLGRFMQIEGLIHLSNVVTGLLLIDIVIFFVLRYIVLTEAPSRQILKKGLIMLAAIVVVLVTASLNISGDAYDLGYSIGSTIHSLVIVTGMLVFFIFPKKLRNNEQAN